MTKVEENAIYNDDNGDSSSNSSPVLYQDPEAFTEDEALATHLSRVMSQPGALERLESLF